MTNWYNIKVSRLAELSALCRPCFWISHLKTCRENGELPLESGEWRIAPGEWRFAAEKWRSISDFKRWIPIKTGLESASDSPEVTAEAPQSVMGLIDSTSYLLSLNGRCFYHFFTKPGALWRTVAENSCHFMWNWQQQQPEPAEAAARCSASTAAQAMVRFHSISFYILPYFRLF